VKTAKYKKSRLELLIERAIESLPEKQVPAEVRVMLPRIIAKSNVKLWQIISVFIVALFSPLLYQIAGAVVAPESSALYKVIAPMTFGLLIVSLLGILSFQILNAFLKLEEEERKKNHNRIKIKEAV